MHWPGPQASRRSTRLYWPIAIREHGVCAERETALSLMDGGAQSPKETWLRLLLIDDGLPTPRTQIRVSDGVNEAFIDMGYDEPMVGFDYEGAHHSTNRGQYVYDIGRAELIDRRGWIDIRVVAEHSRAFILHRAHAGVRNCAHGCEIRANHSPECNRRQR